MDHFFEKWLSKSEAGWLVGGFPLTYLGGDFDTGVVMWPVVGVIRLAVLPPRANEVGRAQAPASFGFTALVSLRGSGRFEGKTANSKTWLPKTRNHS